MNSASPWLGLNPARRNLCGSESFDVRKAFPKIWKLTGQAAQFFQMECRQRCQPLLSAWRQLQPDHSMVVDIPDPAKQPRRLRSIHETDGAVMPK